MVMAAGRLLGEFAALIATTPQHARSTRGMAEYLDTDRNACQQLLAAIAHPQSGLAAAAKLPGEETLAAILKAFDRKKSAKSHVRSARVALDAYRSVLRAEVGNRAALIRLVKRGTDAIQADPAGAEARHLIFRGAASLLGRWSECQAGVSILVPSTTDPERVHAAGGTGLIRHWASASAAPLTRVVGSVLRPIDERENTSYITSLGVSGAAANSCPGVVPQFSSPNLPLSVTRDYSPTEMLVTLDAPSGEQASAIDFVTASKFTNAPHPKLESWPAFVTSARIYAPAERLVMDSYVHQSLARQAVASMAVFRSNVGGTSDGPKLWHERLPVPLTLELLGPGLANSRSAAWPRHAEFVRWMFERLGWNPEEFVGFRCSHTYPLWQCYYEMCFEFGRP